MQWCIFTIFGLGKEGAGGSPTGSMAQFSRRRGSLVTGIVAL